MVELIAHNNEPIETIYQLLGSKENDITKAIAWTLKKCPTFLNTFIHFSRFGLSGVVPGNTTIRYQQYEKTEDQNGYTDLEITDEKNFHLILEAKRGWILPGSQQLIKYVSRPSFTEGKVTHKFLVTVSECDYQYAKNNLPFEKTKNGIPVYHISWKELKSLADAARTDANHEQKHLLEEFIKYLGGLSNMEKEMSNDVYVVPLNKENIEILKSKNLYHCPVGKGYLKKAPNYLGFRYGGQLKSIHHVESYTITKNLHNQIDTMPDEEVDDHFVFSLGPAIIPSKTVRSGKIWNTRVWAMIDTLLTCDTVQEACEVSKKRKKGEE